VRVGAAVGLVTMQVNDLAGEDAERFEKAKEFLGAGRFYLLTGDPVKAIGAFQTGLKLDPEVPVQYFLAYAYAQKGDYPKAR
jgi:tetratricopeptide (TPR) repeat protein